MPSKLPRPYSDKYIQGQGEYDLFKNKNTEWFGEPKLKFFYLSLIGLLWALIRVTNFVSFEDSWTVVNIIHCVVTFCLLHWVKGCPDDTSQGEYNGLTFWEQIDAGTPWTQTKKFLMVIPTVLTLLACYAADYQKLHIIVNIGIFLICIIAKIPEMHGVRILGINSTPGIDTPILLTETRSPGRDKKVK